MPEILLLSVTVIVVLFLAGMAHSRRSSKVIHHDRPLMDRPDPTP